VAHDDVTRLCRFSLVRKGLSVPLESRQNVGVSSFRMLMAARLDHEKTAAESHYCCDRNIIMSVSNEGKKTDEPGNAFVELMSCNTERAGFKVHPTKQPCGTLDLHLT